jgi:hypothetical protein
MVTYKDRMQAQTMSAEDWYRLNEQNKIQGAAPQAGRAGIQ